MWNPALILSCNPSFGIKQHVCFAGNYKRFNQAMTNIDNWQWIQCALEWINIQHIRIQTLGIGSNSVLGNIVKGNSISSHSEMAMWYSFKMVNQNKTELFSFNIPTLECTHMHTTSVLLSYCLNFIQLYKNKVMTLQSFKQVKHKQLNVPPTHCSTFSIHTYIHVHFDFHWWSYRWTISLFLEGGPLPFYPLTQLIQHTSSTCDNTHTLCLHILNIILSHPLNWIIIILFLRATTIFKTVQK